MKLPETKSVVHEMGTIQLSIQLILEDCGMGMPLNWTWQAFKKSEHRSFIKAVCIPEPSRTKRPGADLDGTYCCR